MKILITNDDGYQAKGINTLVRILRPYGDLTVVAPKTVQSGMSMAVSMGFRPIAVKKLEERPGERWWYLDGTPASCVKFGLDNILLPDVPDVIVSGINHGSNACTGAIYSGTIGAAMEGAVNGVKAIGVSLDSFDPDADFSPVEELFPAIFEKLLENFNPRFGSFYNVNFPAIPASQIKGVRVGNMGMAHWEKEYRKYDIRTLEMIGHTPKGRDLWYLDHAEEGEEMYVMMGECVDNGTNTETADHLLLKEGYVTVTPQNIDNTDHNEITRLCAII